MTIQYIIIAIILALAIAYAAYRIYISAKRAGDPCYGCSGCAIHEQMLKKRGKGKKKPVCFNKK
jgi:hypothetical protein